MSNEPKPEETFAHSLERVVEGGLLRVLAGKPVQLAISRLVTGIVAVPEAALEVPTAYLHGIVERIRFDNDARKQVSAVVLKEAKKSISMDLDLTTRGLQRWSANLRTKQRNVENVAARTIELLAEQDELPPGAAAPSEEFMGPFGMIAEDASSEEVGDLVARILAGEIRSPGTFSRRTLQIVATLDRPTIQALLECLPYRLYPGWFHVPPSEIHIWRRRMSLLSSVGITDAIGLRKLGRMAAVRIGAKGIHIECKEQPTYFVDGANLSVSGMELLTAIPQPETLRIKEVALGFKEHLFVETVRVYDAMDGERGGPAFPAMVDVEDLPDD